MGFFQTMADGYSIMWNQAEMAWEKHGAQILTGGGTAAMLVGNVLFARRAAKEETRQAIADANLVLEQLKNGKIVPQEGETEKKAKNRHKIEVAKAHGNKFMTIAKQYWKEAAVSAAGAVAVGVGQHMNTVQKTALATTVAAVSAEFAAYRANVIEDAGAEKDLQYLTSKKNGGKKALKAAGNGENATESEENDGIFVNADPNAFKIYLSPETTPWIYSDNLFLTKSRIEDAERKIEQLGWEYGVVSLNDMRRQLASLNRPNAFDVGIGGILGKRFAPYRGDDGHIKYPHFRLGGWRDDVDFMEGRKVGVWVVFECDEEPITIELDKKAKNKPVESKIV